MGLSGTETRVCLVQRQGSVWYRDTGQSGTETRVSLIQKHGSVWHRDKTQIRCRLVLTWWVLRWGGQSSFLHAQSSRAGSETLRTHQIGSPCPATSPATIYMDKIQSPHVHWYAYVNNRESKPDMVVTANVQVMRSTWYQWHWPLCTHINWNLQVQCMLLYKYMDASLPYMHLQATLRFVQEIWKLL